INYKICKNKKAGIKSWMNYASKKQKADSSSIDKINILKDYSLFSNDDNFTNDSKESYLWSSDGDIIKKDELDKITDNFEGFFWRGFLSFPPEFAINHGLITKADYYSLSNNIITKLIQDMVLDINNVYLYCDFDLDTKHPHINFCFFEKKVTKTNPIIPKYCYKSFRSNVGNYLVDYEKFYKIRDDIFKDIIGNIDLKNLNK